MKANTTLQSLPDIQWVNGTIRHHWPIAVDTAGPIYIQQKGVTIVKEASAKANTFINLHAGLIIVEQFTMVWSGEHPVGICYWNRHKSPARDRQKHQ